MGFVLSLVAAIVPVALFAAEPKGQPPDPLKQLRDDRRAFQDQQLITAKPNSFILTGDKTPRIIWRDADEVRRLGGETRLRVRWFDAALNEAASPEGPGRWIAHIESTAPNGTPVRRGMTFFRPPKDWMLLGAPPNPGPQPERPESIPQEIWDERREELSLALRDATIDGLLDSEMSGILLAGLAEARPLGRKARPIDSATVLHDDHHLALKLKLAGIAERIRPLQKPRELPEKPAAALRKGSSAEAGVSADADSKITALCRAWEKDSNEPFVTLVARRGVIITHRAFGKDKDGKPVAPDYRCQVFSITKTVTGLLFSQFVDQGLIDLEAQVSSVFPDYPKNDPHVPTFRQCFMHTSGLKGHGDFGGMRNPHFENVILNGIDANRPGEVYEYSGMGYDLVAKAMEIVAGKSAARLYHEHLFQPLGFSDILITDANAGAHLTALELATLAQWVLNRGSYGKLQFISEKTFERLLPVPITAPNRGFVDTEGIGIHWMRNTKIGATAHSKNPEDWIFSPMTVGHGSFSGCLFVCDLERQLLVVQARRASGPRHGEWAQKLFQAASECVIEGSQARQPDRKPK